jgi:hypothetical protein
MCDDGTFHGILALVQQFDAAVWSVYTLITDVSVDMLDLPHSFPLVWNADLFLPAGDVCTTDSCSHTAGCVYSDACDDGNPCTVRCL